MLLNEKDGSPPSTLPPFSFSESFCSLVGPREGRERETKAGRWVGVDGGGGERSRKGGVQLSLLPAHTPHTTPTFLLPLPLSLSLSPSGHHVSGQPLQGVPARCLFRLPGEIIYAAAAAATTTTTTTTTATTTTTTTSTTTTSIK
jgi:hypothetical protein